MKTICIIQARVGSTRLPGKILLKVVSKAILLHVVMRVLQAKRIDEVIVATTTNVHDDVIEELVKAFAHPKIGLFRGSENDVLDRYYQAAKTHRGDVIVRITSDCPLIDWDLLDSMVEEFSGKKYDYISNVLEKRTFPRGLDVEVFSFAVLEKMWKTCEQPHEREHVTAHIRENREQFSTKSIVQTVDWSGLRWTLDEPDDFRFIQEVYAKLYPKNHFFTTQEILQLLRENPALSNINQHVEQRKNIKNEAN